MSYSPRNPNGQATMDNSSPVVLASNMNPIPTKVTYFTAAGVVVRPNTTTQYTVGDAITSSTSAPSALYIPNIVSTSGSAFFINEVIITSDAVQPTLPYFKLYISDVNYAQTNDNSVFDLTDDQNENNSTVISLNEQLSTASNSRVAATNLQQIFKTNAGDTGVYATIIADNAYTPVASELLKVIIRGYTT